MSSEIDLGLFKVYLPDGDSRVFMLRDNFSKFLGDEYGGDSVKRIKKVIRSFGVEKLPKMYHGENFIGIKTSSPDIIFEVVKSVNYLALEEFKIGFSNADWDSLHEKLVVWKAPKRQKWETGDIFTLKLLDETFAFGQVLSNRPTIALFCYKKDSEGIEFVELEKVKILTLLHVTANSLNNWSWNVIGNYKLLANKDSGPFGSDSFRVGLTSFSCNVVESVCSYYWFKVSNWTNPKEIEELIMN